MLFRSREKDWDPAVPAAERRLRRERSVVFEPKPVGTPDPPTATPSTATARAKSPERKHSSGGEDAGEDSDSDASSGFANLLSRVSGADPPLLGAASRNKGKGKERDTASLDDAPALLAGLPEADEADADDDDGELVAREEGQADPRDMLREQLRKSEDRSKGGWRTTHSPVTGASRTAVVVVVDVGKR